MPGKITGRNCKDISFNHQVAPLTGKGKKPNMKLDLTKFTGITGRDNYGKKDPVMSQRQEGNRYSDGNYTGD